MKRRMLRTILAAAAIISTVVMYKDEQEVNASTLNSTVMSATENITDSGQCGDNLTWTLENGILTISGTGDMWDYEAIYDSESKTYITDTPWSAYKDSFHTLIIEENVTSIGNNAFRNCSGLVGQVTIPQGVTHIGNAAFYYCEGLTEIVLPDGITTIEEKAFHHCYRLKKVTIPVDYSYTSELFYDCRAVETIHYTKGVTGIMPDIFRSETEADYYKYRLETTARTNIKEIVFDEGITRIGTCALGYEYFDDTYVGVLAEITFPSTLESIGNCAFYGQDNITELDFPSGLKEIGNFCFAYCTGLTDFAFPEQMEVGPYRGFYGCTGLTEVTIPDQMTVIKDLAFGNCTGLKKVTIPVDHDYTSSVFYGCTNVEMIHYTKGVTGIMPDVNFTYDETATSNYYNYRLESVASESLKEVVFDEGITRIGGHAFGYKAYNTYSSVLSKVTFPSTLESIGDGAFYKQENITQIILPEELKEIGESAFSGCTGLADLGPLGFLGFPSQITEIPDSCFANCLSLTELEIPETITSIGKSAFYGCTGLTELEIPETVTSLKNNAFGYCTGLKSVTIPVDFCYEANISPFEYCINVERIHYTKGDTGVMPNYGYADTAANYYDNRLETIAYRSLKEVVFDEGITRIGNLAFGYKERNAGYSGVLSKITFPSTLESIGLNAFYGQENITELDFPSNLKEMGSSCFAYCTGLTDLAFPEQMETVPSQGFYGCTGLTEITIPEHITAIHYRAFGECTGLKKVTIPVDHDYASAIFYGCTNVEMIHYTKGVTGIMPKVNRARTETATSNFYNYRLESVASESLKEVVFDEGITEIGGYVFGYKVYDDTYSSVLSKVTFPSTLESIGDSAFYKQENITEVVFPQGLKEIGTTAFYGCTGLKKVTIPVDFYYGLSTSPFGECTNVEVIHYTKGTTGIMPNISSSTIGAYSYKERLETIAGDSLKEVVFGEGITRIGNSAFARNTAIKNVLFPSGITFIGTDNFDDLNVVWATFYGTKGTVAESCAKEKGITFIPLNYPIITTEATDFIKGNQYLFEAKVWTGIDEYHSNVLWETSGAKKENTFIEENGLLHIASDESVPNFLVTATCDENSADYVIVLCKQHEFVNYVDNNDATCVEDGTKTAKCENCEETETITVEGSAKGHTFINYTDNNDATCVGDGTKTAKCENCEETKTIIAEGSSTGIHLYDEWKVVNESTCVEDGRKQRECKYCDSIQTDTINRKEHSWNDGEVKIEATATESGERIYTCIECKTTRIEEIPATGVEEIQHTIMRISGATRYETGYKVSDVLKEKLGVEKFEAIVVATGKNFADALAGSYLAVRKDAPIILTNGKDDNVAQLHDYIRANVVAGGEVYILGGEAAVPASVEAIEGYKIVRLSGATRYDTNLAILEAAGIVGNEIIVATGKNFADSLSASAVKLPILLVKPGTTLNDAQKEVAKTANGGTIYIIGGEGAVSAGIAEELAVYADVVRVSGKTRYETSVAVAKTFFADMDAAVVASAKNFPDGLCGGPLAAAMNAPLILTADGKTEAATAYIAENSVESGLVLGGTGALADETVVDVFGLESIYDILNK